MRVITFSFVVAAVLAASTLGQANNDQPVKRDLALLKECTVNLLPHAKQEGVVAGCAEHMVCMLRKDKKESWDFRITPQRNGVTGICYWKSGCCPGQKKYYKELRCYAPNKTYLESCLPDP